MKKVYIMEERFSQTDMEKDIKKKGWFKAPAKVVESKRLYLPYWLIEVTLKLKSPLGRDSQIQCVLMLVNAMLGSTQMVKGALQYVQRETDGIFLPVRIPEENAQSQARTQALCLTKKIINPPENDVGAGKLIYYPLSLIKVCQKGKTDLQIFDHFQGGFAKTLLWYIRNSDIDLSF